MTPSAGPSAGTAQVVDVGGRRLRLTSLEKVLWPASGTTKAELVQYLVAVSEPLLAQLAGRPVTRVRWPHGASSPQGFYEKNAPAGAPPWLRTVRLPTSGSRAAAAGSASSREVLVQPVLEDVAGLVWAANLAALELHTPQWRVGPRGAVRCPDRLVVDLDPGPGAGLAECSTLALLVAERLGDDGLQAVPVTSGGRGLQLYAPVSGRQEAAVVSAYARRLAQGLARDHPRLVTAVMTKALRPGRVLLDWSQNSAAKTTVTPYSPRGRERPTAAAPRRWSELGEHLVQLELDEVVARLAADGDLLAAALRPGSPPGPRLPER
ncbi:non-homologous end-joining DNA ligase [Quadrisphaera sp. DSM 44207]|uniref:non-homologous end-joining DNA ligase n=1 Tax=Quadrisphaera sp. DSM 44207 TaxID=1881057 RepID=UPI0008895FCC|nr:non-homologous end-joining DNA ligase [Quadrisphaera sp. DSM 44207]SDQ65669.1 bifunctional non-homologous end joining protein LigD [Quadrisphaera sp. DSM 44207]